MMIHWKWSFRENYIERNKINKWVTSCCLLSFCLLNKTWVGLSLIKNFQLIFSSGLFVTRSSSMLLWIAHYWLTLLMKETAFIWHTSPSSEYDRHVLICRFSPSSTAVQSLQQQTNHFLSSKWFMVLEDVGEDEPTVTICRSPADREINHIA